MFRWPQSGGSMNTESSELFGKEGFLPTPAAKTVSDLNQLFGLKKQKW